MKAALVIALEPLSPLAPLAPLAPVTGAELLPPQPAAARIATTALQSARYTHLPHTQRPKVASQPARPGAEPREVNRSRQRRSELPDAPTRGRGHPPFGGRKLRA